jgi:protein-tyrosine phosphatase
MSSTRTSLTHPLQIGTLPLGDAGGAVGLTLCPGKQGDSVYGAPWARNLELDMQAIRDWGAHDVVTLIEHHEFTMLGVPSLGEAVQQHGMRWHHLPIPDVDVPGTDFAAGWRAALPVLLTTLASGGRVLVHCRGGLGRAGMAATMLAIEMRLQPADALALVRSVRPGAVETPAQMCHVLRYRPLSVGPGCTV